MFVALDRSMLLTLLVVLSTTSTLVRSQAPGDAHPSCTKQSVPDDVVMLLDSAWYRSLLTSVVYESAGWTQTPDGSWKGSGNLCFRTVKSCDGASESGLVTQYINKTANVTYALKITVDIEGDATGSDPIRVYYYPSDGPIANGAQLQPSNYNHIGNVSFGVRSTREVVTFFLDSRFDRFYIAIVEADSCFTLRRLRVWYSLCPAETDGLIVYPGTPVGDSAVNASASCKADAIPVSSLSVTCNTDGTYSGSPDCSCREGHVESGEACHACAAGTYAMPGATSCLPCPENSYSEREASFCSCNESYVRSDPENGTLPCKSGPCTESVPNLDIQGTNLNPGEEVTYGLLEICVGGSFLQVCSDVGVNLAAADFACIALGYEGADDVQLEDHDGTSTPVVTSLSCPNPGSPVGCTYNTGSSCPSGKVVQLHCLTTTPTTAPPVTTPAPVAVTLQIEPPGVTTLISSTYIDLVCNPDIGSSSGVGMTFSWSGPNGMISNGPEYTITVEDDSSTLRIEELDVNRDNNAVYTCLVLGDVVGGSSLTLSVRELDGDDFEIVTSVPGTPTAGDNFTITCIVMGPYRLTVTPQLAWEVQINDMAPIDISLAVDDIGVPTIGNTVATGSGNFSKTLSFTQIRTSQARRYVCGVFISGVISESGFADLHVQIPPPLLTVSVEPAVDPIYSSTAINLTCTALLAKGVDTATMAVATWTGPTGTHDVLCQQPSDSRICVIEAASAEEGLYESTLVFDAVDDQEDTGLHTCDMAISSNTMLFEDKLIESTSSSGNINIVVKESPASPPNPFEVFGPFIAWGPPERHDGEILRYEVKITSVTGAYVILEKNKMDVYHILEREDVPSDLGRSRMIGIQVRAVTTEGVGDWSAEEFNSVSVLIITDVIPHLLDPEPKITLINDSPIVSGKDVEIHLATNHDVSFLKCRLESTDPIHLGDDEDYRDCSSGMITYTNLPTAALTFYALAKVQTSGQVISLKRSFRPAVDFECSVHLINDGLTIDGSDAVIEYVFTGNFTGCSLDRANFYNCSSPVELPNLSSGKHSLKITSQPCPKTLRYPVKLDFDIP